ncbi:Hsp20 family protein [Undibacterium sp. CY18W]|uniref:Hsp20 family protein n=1 Tax=Undibacterium hunanense TaxID=2762292 RepID=A0ABR6ZM91_9BURK|nr:Hsp20 family protein [Undibacterium hunanense]MBC3917021.1 Hsp20 family protein [Undibacterium hunanense]
MRNFDFAPLYRSAIGFDRLAQLFDDAQRAETAPSYPPYNIELIAEDKYAITMAVAGFDRSEIDIESERDTLKIVGRRQKAEGTRNFLHRGIASRDFEHRFRLADHVKVISARLDNGLLNIELVREIPEAHKPRRILIDADNLQLVEPQNQAQNQLQRQVA